MSERYRTWTKGQRPPRRPELGVYFSGRRNDLSVDLTARLLTPARLGEILREAEAGSIARQCEALDQCESDPHIHSVLQTRKLAAVAKEMLLAPADDTPAAKAAHELCEAQLGDLESFDEVLLDLYDAIGKGFSAAQIAWDFVGGKYVVRSLEWWPQREFTLDKKRPGELRVITDTQSADGEALDPWQWIVHQSKAKSGSLAQAPLLRVIVWFYLFKHYSLKDWVIFSEACGIPRRFAKYPRGASDDELNAIADAVISLGKDGAAVIPEGAELGFVELKGQGQGAKAPMEGLAAFCNAEISKAVLGQTLTTEVGDSGSRALGQVHENVRRDLTEADCKAMARTIRRDLLTPIVRFNLGDAAPVPKCSFVFGEDEDLLQRAQRDQIIAEMGMEFSKEQLREIYSLREPRDDDDTLVMQRAASPAPASDRGLTDLLSIAGPEIAGQVLLKLAEKKRSMTWGQ